MKKLKLSTNSKNRILAILIGIIGCVALSLMFDCFYDMNDDVFMKNILSGIYTGKPEGHNIQMLYPLAFIISVFYRILPSVPWYGLFLTGSIFAAFYLCLYKGLSHIQKKRDKVILTSFLILLFIGLLLWEMVYIQYTVVCGILTAAAAVCLMLTPRNLSVKDFLKQNVVSVLLVVIAFNLRTEMFLLLSPFIAIAGLLRWNLEKRALTKENFIKYGTIIFSIAALLLLSLGLNRIAYNSREWQEFNAFFDARTQVYDYTWYPDYEENKEFYDKIGISQGQYNLIDNYNFGLDNRIDTGVLNQIAEYQTTKNNQEVVLSQKVKETIWQYVHQTFNFSMQTEHETRVMPYNVIVIILYIWLLLLLIIGKDKYALLKILYMIALRSVSWLYILWGGRVVARLTHPLYLIEIIIVLSYILMRINKGRQDHELNNTRYLNSTFLAIMTLAILITISDAVTAAKNEQTRREEVNKTDQTIQEYCINHPENYYYIDVYTTVSFSEKIFKSTKHAENCDILGGWVSKSPLTEQKEKQHGIMNINDDLVAKDNICFIAEDSADVEWLKLYYEEQNQKIEVKNTNKLNGNLIINIYDIEEND